MMIPLICFSVSITHANVQLYTNDWIYIFFPTQLIQNRMNNSLKCDGFVQKNINTLNNVICDLPTARAGHVLGTTINNNPTTTYNNHQTQLQTFKEVFYSRFKAFQ